MSEHEEHDEEKVGYGHPPRHARFKKGQSGNPKGRPKGSKNLKTILHEIYFEKVPITVDGRKQKVFAFAAAVLRLRNNAFEGDERSIHQYVTLGLKHLSDDEDEHVEDTLSHEEDDILRSLLERRGNESEDRGE